MSDNGSSSAKSAGIPAWQQAKAGPIPKDAANEKPTKMPEENTTQPDDNQTTESQTPAESTADLIEQGKRFLLDPTTLSAPLEAKRSFLEAQGLSHSDVDRALEAAQTSQSSPQPSVPQTAAASPPPPPPTPQQQQDAPPIITYPEWLSQPAKPPPIITAQRLLTTAYVASAIGTAIWGCNKYLIAPMLENMTSARHEFATHTTGQVDELNTRIRGVVSSEAKERLQDREEKTEDEDDDPTELFHRDYGTQTSPSLIHDDSSSSASDDGPSPTDPAAQAFQLNAITAHCKALSNDDIIDSSEDQSTLTVIRVLRDYLESLAYPGYSGSGVYGSSGKKEEDEVGRFRNEIRSVKGTLLSARNFPSTRGGAVGGMGARGSLFPGGGK